MCASERLSPLRAHHVPIQQLQRDVHAKAQRLHAQLRAEPVVTHQPGDEHKQHQFAVARPNAMMEAGAERHKRVRVYVAHALRPEALRIEAVRIGAPDGRIALHVVDAQDDLGARGYVQLVELRIGGGVPRGQRYDRKQPERFLDEPIGVDELRYVLGGQRCVAVRHHGGQLVKNALLQLRMHGEHQYDVGAGVGGRLEALREYKSIDRRCGFVVTFGGRLILTPASIVFVSAIISSYVSSLPSTRRTQCCM